MEKLIVTLSDDAAGQLRIASKKLGKTPEDLARASLQEELATIDEDFVKAMDYVLQKNAPLYERLA